MIAKGKFVRGNLANATSHLKRHMCYLEHRSRDLELELRADRHLFNGERDHIDRREAVDDVMGHTSTGVNYHKLILSPGEDEPVYDYHQWTRDVMEDLQEWHGHELHWYGVVHQNTDHPHVHVVIAGAGENLDTGKIETVKLYRWDYEHLRESGRAFSEYDFRTQFLDELHELDRLDTVPRELGEHQMERDTSQEPSVAFDRDGGYYDR